MGDSLRDELRAAGIFDEVKAAFDNQSPERRRLLEDLIVEACVDARRYSELGSDRFEHRRARDRAARRDIPACLKATERLPNFLKEFPKFTTNIAYVAFKAKDLDRSGLLSRALKEDAGRACSDFLTSFDRALESAQLSANKRGFLHGYQVGPLVYPTHIARRQGSRPRIAETGLVFQLTIYFRRFSARKPNVEYLQNPEPMPEYGKPHYELTSGIVKTALGKAATAHALYKRMDDLLRANPGIGLGAWPTD